mgnify:CR=1 FL=1
MPAPAALLPNDAWIVVSASRRSLDRAEAARREAAALAEATGWTGSPAVAIAEEALGSRERVDLTEFAEGIELGVRGWDVLRGKPEELAARAAALASQGFQIAVTAEGRGSLQRAVEVLERAGVPHVPEDLAVRTRFLNFLAGDEPSWPGVPGTAGAGGHRTLPGRSPSAVDRANPSSLGAPNSPGLYLR